MLTILTHRLNKTQGQALIELAVGAGALLMAMSLLLAYGLNINNTQRMQMDAFRNAVKYEFPDAYLHNKSPNWIDGMEYLHKEILHYALELFDYQDAANILNAYPEAGTWCPKYDDGRNDEVGTFTLRTMRDELIHDLVFGSGGNQLTHGIGWSDGYVTWYSSSSDVKTSIGTYGAAGNVHDMAGFSDTDDDRWVDYWFWYLIQDCPDSWSQAPVNVNLSQGDTNRWWREYVDTRERKRIKGSDLNPWRAAVRDFGIINDIFGHAWSKAVTRQGLEGTYDPDPESMLWDKDIITLKDFYDAFNERFAVYKMNYGGTAKSGVAYVLVKNTPQPTPSSPYGVPQRSVRVAQAYAVRSKDMWQFQDAANLSIFNFDGTIQTVNSNCLHKDPDDEDARPLGYGGEHMKERTEDTDLVNFEGTFDGQKRFVNVSPSAGGSGGNRAGEQTVYKIWCQIDVDGDGAYDGPDDITGEDADILVKGRYINDRYNRIWQTDVP